LAPRPTAHAGSCGANRVVQPSCCWCCQRLMGKSGDQSQGMHGHVHEDTAYLLSCRPGQRCRCCCPRPEGSARLQDRGRKGWEAAHAWRLLLHVSLQDASDSLPFSMRASDSCMEYTTSKAASATASPTLLFAMTAGR
jgi:hypothetical protein